MICSIKVPRNFNLLQNKQWRIQDLPEGANPRGMSANLWFGKIAENARNWAGMGSVQCSPVGSAAACVWCRNRVRVKSWNKLSVHTSWRLFNTCKCQSAVSILPQHTLSHALQLSIIHTLILIGFLTEWKALKLIDSIGVFFLKKVPQQWTDKKVSLWTLGNELVIWCCNLRYFYTFYKCNRAAVTRRMCNIKI